MKSTRVLALLLIVLSLFGTAPAGWADPTVPAASPTPAVSPTLVPTIKPSPSPDGKRDYKALYGEYLKDPASLGFRPDLALFRTIYDRITSIHADSPTDAQLYAGVVDEVRGLLTVAHLSPAALDGMARDQSLAETIDKTWGSEIDRRILWYAMIRGLFAGTGDAHSSLLTPREYRGLMETLQTESFVGVGIYVDLDPDNKDQLTIVEPVEGGPAFKAGVMARDQVIRIDGKPTQGLTLDAARKLIRGPRGTKVTFTIKRGTETKDIAIERAALKIPSVVSSLLPNNIAYLRLRVFGAETGHEFKEALSSLMAKGAKGIILDLRNNGGGYNTAAVAVCSPFLRPGELVTYMINKRGERREYRGGQADPVRLPVVVLVNKYSASASEITSGCLRDNANAVLLGTRTYGKGSSQQVIQLGGGAGCRVTFAHFYSPKGTKIDKVGLEPTVSVDMEPRLVGRGEGKDIQLQRAVQYLMAH